MDVGKCDGCCYTLDAKDEGKFLAGPRVGMNRVAHAKIVVGRVAGGIPPV